MLGESRPTFWTRALAGAAIVLLLALLAVQAFGLWQAAEFLRRVPHPRLVVSMIVDEMIESGLSPGRPPEILIESRRIVLSNAINDLSVRPVIEGLFLLDDRDPGQPIELYLSSAGGWEGNAFAIIDTMQEIEAPVNAHALGFCYSSCAMILAAATGRRSSTENTILMVHANLEESNGRHSFERLARERYEHLWRKHARLPERWFPMTGDEEYYLSPGKALEYGIIDEIDAGKPRGPAG